MNNFGQRPFQITPVLVLNSIIYTNIALFIVSLVLSGTRTNITLNPFNALSPDTNILIFMGASGKIPINAYGNWWSLITANWLHGSLLHIIFNMLALRTIAPLVLNEFGLFRMFSIYTLTGAAGFLASYFGNVNITIGASSGLCGLIGASLYFGRSRGGSYGQMVYQQTFGWVVTLVLIGFFIPNINNWGHGGGLISGVIFSWLLGYNAKRREHFLDKFLSLAL
ncbi:MAG: rhomboid family intramembrane serine protease, partial [Desulfobacteraceae bacterium]|nr:rhomboid family intramembrane serine protease [Desulfobacteraceae bacterium]